MIWLKKLLIWHYTTAPYPARMANMGDEFDDEVSFRMLADYINQPHYLDLEPTSLYFLLLNVG
jgi:hypothetical protein